MQKITHPPLALLKEHGALTVAAYMGSGQLYDGFTIYYGEELPDTAWLKNSSGGGVLTRYKVFGSGGAELVSGELVPHVTLGDGVRPGIQIGRILEALIGGSDD